MKLRNFLLILSGMSLACSLSAYELDWADENWVGSNSASQSQIMLDIDDSGVDARISVLVNGVSSFARTTSISGNGDMYLAVDYTNRNRNSNYVDVTIQFSQLVQGVSFRLNDVDKGTYDSSDGSYGSWEDVIENISGNAWGTAVAGSVTPGSSHRVDTTSEPGDTLYRGIQSEGWNTASQMQLTWSDPVSEVSFRWSGGEQSYNNPAYQIIGMGGISFYEYQAVPEPSTYLFGGLTSVALAVSFVIRRRKQKSKTRCLGEANLSDTK